MEVSSASDRAPARPDLAEVFSSDTREMLAALPEGLMVPDGATAQDRRLTDVLALYRSVFLNSADPIAIVDTPGRYLEQNFAHEALLGYTADELRGFTPAIHLGNETFASVAAELEMNGHARREVRSLTKAGRERLIELSAFAVRDRQGVPVCYVGIKRDITEQRHAAVELRQRVEELSVLYRMTDSLARAGDLAGIYEEAIGGLLQATGADRASVLLFDGGGVMRFRAWRGLSDAYRAAVEGHSPWERDARDPLPVTVQDVTRDPQLVDLLPVLSREGIRSLAFVPLVAETGELVGKFMLYFDTPHQWTPAELQLACAIARQVAFAITRHERLSMLRDSVAEQQRLFGEANEANRVKSVFLGTMSHELRTPLNAIAGYADLLDAAVHGDMNAKQRESIQRIQTNQRHLLRLIDDVLDFAKLEAGHLKLEITDVRVQETLEGTRALIELQMRARDITCRFASGDPRATCRADRAKMQQILTNLLSNATKFTPQGGTVGVDWEATDDTVRVHVRDSGPGIDAAHLETIFEPFVQLQAGLRRRVEGTGLGLAISRELARSMGGDVTATSVVGQGSIFTLTLRHH